MSLKRSNRRAGVPLIAAICLLTTVNVFAASAPMSDAQIALYQGMDREKMLIEGAKREGQLTFYNSHTWFRSYVKEFEKKYPFIKVVRVAQRFKESAQPSNGRVRFYSFFSGCH